MSETRYNKRVSMRFSGISLLLGIVALALVPLSAQQAADLPSAPSAARTTKPAPPPAPAAPAPVQAPSSAPNETAPIADTSKSSAPAPDVEPDGTTIRKNVNEVNIVFTVSDKHGRHIKDLKRDDFHVVDDNRPATISSFHSETNLPLQVGLLVDASNSVRDRFKFEQESAIEFLSQTIRPRYDKAFIVGFDATPEVTQDFTDNTETLSRGVRMLKAGGGTALYDALYFACRDKLLKQPTGTPVRKAVVLLSDGEDNLSHVTREEAIDMAQRAEVVVYTISTNVTGSRARGDKVLQRIADATGGYAFFPFQITDVANAFSEIQDELRSQYALSYTPAEFRADGRYHTIEILASNHKNLHVRSRRGYYAPTAQ